MTLQREPVTGAGPSDAAAFLHVNLNHEAPAATCSDPEGIERTRPGRESGRYRDHAGTATAHHLVLTHGNGSCSLMRTATRKSLSIFAAILILAM